ncbi:HupE/UreJ family protein [Steroidobacter sp.]|uniref:HupE/UreJ family protein n=1 Tax=Steroidobacter sp. TaxID=1978227 RepID=UPI001A3945C3|nr:HupE/UreJ family protein [Steroidobacter sp.]MBL8268761.1 HupE/UreJ family protein [Steroidobacter sp.]
MRALHVLMLALLSLVASAVSAHELSMAEMEIRETTPGEFLWQWTASGDKAAAVALTPIWPDSCVADMNMLRCGEQGLFGTLKVDGVGARYSAAIVKIFWLDGQSRVFTLTTGQPEVHLYGSAEDTRGMGEIARAYAILGVEHILGGFDHLLFVLSLLFLVSFNKRLVLTISAFTLAHSLTLALSALGWLTLRSPPVEATIALSIMLVAGEALNKEQTLSRRWPALVAFLFGLIHGLGFAGALADIGLPQKHLFVALLTFNVGVEVGQLLVVVLAYGLYRAFAARPQFLLARTPALYAIGGIAAYWSIGRVVSILA